MDFGLIPLMRSLTRLLGLPARSSDTSPSPPDTATVRRIVERLDRLEPDLARYLAAFAYVLARVAHADREISAEEKAAMQTIVRETGGLPAEQAELVVELAGSSAIEFGATENYVVTRQFRTLSTPEQRRSLLQSLFAVAAADESISSLESNQINQIGSELGLTRQEIAAVRGTYRDQLEILKGLPGTDRGASD